MKNLLRQFPVTLLFVTVSVVVALLSNFGASTDALQLLLISQFSHGGLDDIFAGQLWRLVTPMFIHFGFLHLIFNMMWMWDLGKLIETKKGAGFYLGFILLVSASSNLAQYLLTQSVMFGGMSGVVYGLFGYVWIRGRVDRSFASGLHKTTVNMMLAWFVLCWTGLLGPIANWAHTAGLLAGAIWAYAENRMSKSSVSQDDPAQLRHHSLEYLSTTDMLQIESQREWVRRHFLPEASDKYETVDGKLLIIESILHQSALNALSPDQQGALEIVFGDALAHETGVQWAIVVEDNKRTPVLLIPGSPATIFPLVGFEQMRSRTDGVRHLFDHAVRTIHLNQQKSGSDQNRPS